MPELPEVETTRKGIAPYLVGEKVDSLVVRESRFRWPVPKSLAGKIQGQEISRLVRRGKYLLFTTPIGSFLWHLGMSGSMRMVQEDTPLNKHDHIDLRMSNGWTLRYNDPRRFGCLLWAGRQPEAHVLIASLGPEPLETSFDAAYLYTRARGKTQAVKNYIMDSKAVVGVGNIYASEALFMARIRPEISAGRISKRRYEGLVRAIKQVLEQAILAGGTTLNDFSQADGQPGYFAQALQVYGRQGLPCSVCDELIVKQVIGQRASFYCRGCQR